MARAPVVDIVVGPQSYHRLADLVAQAAATGKGVIATEFPAEDKFAHLPERPRAKAQPSAFVTVQEGCDKFCTFCVVPYTRGAEFSRSPAEIVAEVESACGARHARDHAARPERQRLSRRRCRRPRLVAREAVASGSPKCRGSSGSASPRATRATWTTSLIALFGDEPKLMPYLHLPFQAGSDRILAAMNRKHTADDYEALIGKVRAARPDIALSTDIIVGFPGETDDDFEATLALVARARFAQAFSFKYSARPGTAAATFDGQVPEAVKRERLHALQSLLDRTATHFDQATVGRKLKVLFEGRGRKPGQIAGRSPYLQAVHAEGPRSLIGEIVEVDIVAAGPNSLHGVINLGFAWREPVQAAV